MMKTENQLKDFMLTAMAMDKLTNADRYHYNQPAAQFYFGLNSNLRYKNWDLAFSGRATIW